MLVGLARLAWPAGDGRKVTNPHPAWLILIKFTHYFPHLAESAAMPMPLCHPRWAGVLRLLLWGFHPARSAISAGWQLKRRFGPPLRHAAWAFRRHILRFAPCAVRPW